MMPAAVAVARTAGCVMTIETVGADELTYAVGAKVPTAVAVTVVEGPEGADIRPRATAADGGGDLSSGRICV